MEMPNPVRSAPWRRRASRVLLLAVLALLGGAVSAVLLWSDGAWAGAGANVQPAISDAGVLTEWNLPPGRGPFEMHWDEYRQSIWFSEGNHTQNPLDQLGTIDPASGLLKEWGAPTQGGYVHDITDDHGHNIWFSEVEAGKIARLQTDSNTITEWTLYPNTLPHDVTVDDTISGTTTVWISERELNVISSLDPTTGVYVRHTDPMPNAWPHSLFLAADHSIWFVETCGGRVGQFVPGDPETWRFWQPNTPPVPCSPPDHIGPLFGFFVGSDFWYSEPYNGNIIRLRPAQNSFSIWTVPGGGSGSKLVTQVSADPDENIFYPVMNGNQIGRLEPSGASPPTVVVVTPTVVTQAAPAAATAPVVTVVYTPIVTQLTPVTQVLTGARTGGFVEWTLPSVSPTPAGRWIGPARLEYGGGSAWMGEVSANRVGQFSLFTPTTVATSTPLLTPSPLVTSTPSPTSTPPPTSTACPVQFTDVPQGSAFYTYVRCMACRGLINGYTSGCETGNPCFRPNNNVTRGQLSKIVSNAAGYADVIPSTQQTFDDVPNSNVFWLYVERVYAHMVVNGYNGNGVTINPCTGGVEATGRLYFRPCNNATRGQFAKIDAIAAGYTDVIPSTQQTFDDVPNTNTFWLYVERVYAHGVINGYNGDGATINPCTGTVEVAGHLYFRPCNNTTRGQAAKIVSNTFFPNCQTPRR